MKTPIKITGILFLLLAGAAPLLYSLFFHIRQQTIRDKMEEKLDKQVLHSITMAEGDIHWIRAGKEILINNRLFDIKSFTSYKGSCTFTGLFDEEETSLTQLQNHQQRNDGPGEEALLALFHLLQSVYQIPVGETPAIIAIAGNEFGNCRTFLPSSFIAILTPPPQI